MRQMAGLPIFYRQGVFLEIAYSVRLIQLFIGYKMEVE